MKKSFKTKSRGQITLFIVLIFQALFVFFAMVINIGLAVHDKINLQNSVDLGAIYAAQRQAEVLNALAHINYQMRQSYKLFAWRYLVAANLGSHTYKRGRTLSPSSLVDYNILNEPNAVTETNRASCSKLRNGCDVTACRDNLTLVQNKDKCPYAACFWHDYWFLSNTISSNSDFFCQNVTNSPDPVVHTITTEKFEVSRYLHSPLQELISDRQGKLRNISKESCKNLGKTNWEITASIFYAFQLDIIKRKALIEQLYQKTLQEDKDIEGESITGGTLKTIVNNLTYVNYKNYNPQINTDYKPQILPNGKTAQAFIETYPKGNFDNIFFWNKVSPILFYVADAENPSACERVIKQINNYSTQIRDSFLDNSPLKIAVEPRELDMDFFKKDDKKFYVTIDVTIPYSRQIFFPDKNPVNFRAKAIAKPFGAVFGPNKEDNLLPRDFPQNSSDMMKNAPNHSLFPGDKIGLYARSVQWGWNRLFTLNINTLPFPPEELPSDNLCPPVNNNHDCKNNLKKGQTGTNYFSLHQLQDPMVLPYEENSSLAPEKSFNNHLRILEEIAIAPDLFDAAYYTILPNYMTTLFPKIIKTVPASLDLNFGGRLPGDLGHNPKLVQDSPDIFKSSQPQCHTQNQRDGMSSLFRLNYIEKQINCANNFPVPDDIKPAFSYYKVQSLDHLLTSWTPNEDDIGKCSGSQYKNDAEVSIGNLFNNNNNSPAFQKLIPHHCLKGGRSGFSVKLVNENAT